MNVPRRIAPCLLLLALAAGCGGDDNPTEPPPPASGTTIADVVGSWSATSSVHTNNADSSETLDAIAAGAELRFTMLTGGGTRTWVEFGAFSDEWDAAVTISGSALTSNPVEEGRPTRVFQFTLVGGVLTLTDANSEFDFTLADGAPVSTTEVIVFARS